MHIFPGAHGTLRRHRLVVRCDGELCVQQPVPDWVLTAMPPGSDVRVTLVEACPPCHPP